MAKPRPRKGPPKYSWIESADGIVCYRNPSGFQTLTALWEVRELSDFHDAEMAKATKEINAILSRVEKSNRDPTRNLSWVLFNNRHFLVWAKYGVVGSDDDDATIMKSLGLGPRRRSAKGG